MNTKTHKNICSLLNIKYPVIQGGMANIADHSLVSAVSNAGGLGLIGSGGWSVERIREEIHKTRAHTKKPFGLNIMLMHPEKEAIAKLACEENIKVITTGAGNPGPFMAMWKEAGITVIPVVPSVALAKRVVRNGADAVIVEGTEAGGHVGEISTFSLVPQTVDAVDVAVIAAGGIADTRGVNAAFALGASGVQIGTILLASEECPIHINYKQKIVDARDTDTIVTGRMLNAPVRVLKNKMSKRYLKMSKEGIHKMELEKLTLGSHKLAVLEGDKAKGSFMAGQISGLIKRIQPVKTILSEIFDNESLCEEAKAWQK